MSRPSVWKTREYGKILFTIKEREAVIDALSRVLAGEYDGDLPIKFYERALEKVL